MMTERERNCRRIVRALAALNVDGLSTRLFTSIVSEFQAVGEEKLLLQHLEKACVESGIQFEMVQTLLIAIVNDHMPPHETC